MFTERATALYLPAGVELKVAADTVLEAVLISTPAPAGGTPILVGPNDIKVNARGRANYAREVHDIFVSDPHVKRLMVGETYNPPGNWSSYPPHKHDGRDGEPTLEEMYYFTIDPPQGFGQQILYTNDGESAAHSVGRRRRAASVWVSPGCRPRRATASAICGAWPASSANWRCTRTPRTSGSTTRSCKLHW